MTASRRVLETLSGLSILMWFSLRSTYLDFGKAGRRLDEDGGETKS